MFRFLRMICFLLLFALCFLPLGSCVSKTSKMDSGGVSTSFHGIDELSDAELARASINEIKIYKSADELKSGENTGWELYLIVLAVSFVSTKIRRFQLLVKPAGFLATFMFSMIYIFYALLSITSPTTTVYGWVFIVAGIVYLGAWVPTLIPRFTVHA